MISSSKTSVVYNNPNKIVGLPPYYYIWRVCDTNLTSNTPANQYQRLKQIQNTVRVPASLYTSNLGPLTVYKQPTSSTNDVCWNQMSDRPIPSVQKASIPSGTGCSLNRKHTSVTSSRPGCQTPGGIGVDIKHNSYDRYLNRLKGKSALRRGQIPPNFGYPIKFNPAFPVYGGKTTKTNIVSGCDCPIGTETLQANLRIYNDPLYQPYPNQQFQFAIGQQVYAIQTGNRFYTKAHITFISDEEVTLHFDDDIIETQSASNLLLYFPCNCNGIINNTTYSSGFLAL
jgi:hypothetical protein